MLDHRSLYNLAQALMDAILEAKSKDEARLAASDVVRESEAWNSKRADLRGKRSGDKKS